MRIGQNDNLMAINIGQGCSRCIITKYIKMIRNENNNDIYHLYGKFTIMKMIYYLQEMIYFQ